MNLDYTKKAEIAHWNQPCNAFEWNKNFCYSLQLCKFNSVQQLWWILHKNCPHSGCIKPLLPGPSQIAFLTIVVDHAEWSAINKVQNFNLLDPSIWPSTLARQKLKQVTGEFMAARKAVGQELKTICNKQLSEIESAFLTVDRPDIISAVWTHIKCLAAQEKLLKLGEKSR